MGAQDSRSGLLLPGLLLLLLAPLLSTCGPGHETDCLKSTGPVETLRRGLLPFHTLTVYDNVDVTLVQDSVFYAEVRTGRHLQEDLELTVQDSALTIRNTSRCNWMRRYNVPREVTIHLPSVLNLFQRGENSLRTAGLWRANRLFCHLIGAGDVDLTVDCTDVLSLDLYQLGDMHLRGRTRGLLFNLGGLGTLHARELTAEETYFQTNFDSGGDVHVRSTQELHGHHEGTGTVHYYGQPPVYVMSGDGRVVAEP